MEKENQITQTVNKILEKANEFGLITKDMDLLSVRMDMDCALRHFDIDIDRWLSFDESDFAYDFYGIIKNIVRDKYPSNNFGLFIPRCAR